MKSAGCCLECVIGWDVEVEVCVVQVIHDEITIDVRHFKRIISLQLYAGNFASDCFLFSVSEFFGSQVSKSDFGVEFRDQIWGWCT